jgi:PAS domain S-box-containing protein
MKLNKLIVTSDLHFTEIINFFPDPCFAIDLEGKVIAWNQAMVEFTGISSFDMLGKGEYEYAIPLYGSRRPILVDLAINWNEDIAKTYKYVKKKDDTLVSEVENVFFKQKLFYLWNTARKLYNINGDCIGAIEVIRDVTEINRAKEMSYRYDLLKEESRDIILFINIEDGHILEANNAAVNAYGYNHKELLSMTIWDLRAAPGWDLVVDQIIEAKNKGIMFEAEHRRKNGSIFPVEVSSKGVTTRSGRILISIIRDITERKKAEQALKESEARFRTVVENSWDGIHQLDLHTGKYVFVSPSQERLTGFKIEELMFSMKEAAERVHPDDRASAKKYLKQIISGGRPEKPMEYRWRVKSGEYRWFSDSRKAVFDKNGKAISLVGITRDVTEIKQIQAELEKSKIELEKKVAERTRLAEARAKQLQALAVELIEAEERERRRVAELLHDDLQQMLAAARMQLELVCRRLPSESILVNVVQLLEESIDKSRRLSYELSPAMLHHSGLVTALQWLVRQQGEQFGLHVELESNEDQQLESTPLKVFLFRAVQELLFNIVKHAKVKSARVVLSFSDSCISISVSDKGRGFNPLILDNHTLIEGLGLLSLRERARYIGGNLVIESIPGKGSCFTLTVPFRITTGEKSPPLIRSDDGQYLTSGDDLESTDPRDIRVLFVDDHQVMRQGLISLISGQPGIQVAGEAANGLEAIRMVRQLKPDVVLMDVSMPEMDGIEATRRIKADIPDVRVIGLSMFDDEQMASIMLEAGAETFVSKTASSAELLKAIYAMSRFAT